MLTKKCAVTQRFHSQDTVSRPSDEHPLCWRTTATSIDPRVYVFISPKAMVLPRSHDPILAAHEE